MSTEKVRGSRIGYWVPHELKLMRGVERRIFLCERTFFLHRVVASDEKWMQYDNPIQLGVVCYELLKPGETNICVPYGLQFIRLKMGKQRKFIQNLYIYVSAGYFSKIFLRNS